jgi:hypothetical protein
MSDSFDPYHVWLGIPPDERPPSHYRLLGLREFESDGDVITNAYDQRRVFLRTLQNGKRAELSQKILNEVTRAGVTLLDPQHKTAYDADLRARTAAPPPPAPVPLTYQPLPAPFPPTAQTANLPPLGGPPAYLPPAAVFPPEFTRPLPPAYAPPPPRLPPGGGSAAYAYGPPPVVPSADFPDPPAYKPPPEPDGFEYAFDPAAHSPLSPWEDAVAKLAAQLRIPPRAVLAGGALIGVLLLFLLISSLWNNRGRSNAQQPVAPPPAVLAPPPKSVAKVPPATTGPENPTPPPTTAQPSVQPVTNPPSPALPAADPRTVWLSTSGSPPLVVRKLSAGKWLLRYGAQFIGCTEVAAQPSAIMLFVGNSRSVLILEGERALATSFQLGSKTPLINPSWGLELARGGWSASTAIPPELASIPPAGSANWADDKQWGLVCDGQAQLRGPLPEEIASARNDFTLEFLVCLSACEQQGTLCDLGPLRLVCAPSSAESVLVGVAGVGKLFRALTLPTEIPVLLVLEYRAAARTLRLRMANSAAPDELLPEGVALSSEISLGNRLEITPRGLQGAVLGYRASRGLRYAQASDRGPLFLTPDNQTVSLWDLNSAPGALQDIVDSSRTLTLTGGQSLRLSPLRAPVDAGRENRDLRQAIAVRKHVVTRDGCNQFGAGRTLSTDASGPVLVLAPRAPPGNYLIQLAVTRKTGTGGLLVALPSAGKQVLLGIDLPGAGEQRFTGFLDEQLRPGAGQTHPPVLGPELKVFTIGLIYGANAEALVFVSQQTTLLWRERLALSQLPDYPLPFKDAFAFGSLSAGIEIGEILLLEPGESPTGAATLATLQAVADQAGMKLFAAGRERPGLSGAAVAAAPSDTPAATEARLRAQHAAELAAASSPPALDQLGLRWTNDGRAASDPNEKRAYWRLAQDAYFRAQNAADALAVAVLIDRQFDPQQWTETQTALARALELFGPRSGAEETSLTRKQRSEIARIALGLAEEAAKRRERTVAESNLALAESLRSDKPAELARQMRLKYLLAGWSALLAAEEKLKLVPDDKESHAVVGRWLCFGLEDFSAGAPHLAKGGPTGQFRIAARELQALGDAKKLFAVAEEWFKYSPPSPQENAAVRRHCLELFREAAPGLSPLEKPRAEGRIQTLEKDPSLQPQLPLGLSG